MKRAAPSSPEVSDNDDDGSDGDAGFDMPEPDPEPPRPRAERAVAEDTTSVAASLEEARMDAQLAKAFTRGGSALATKRLMAEYKAMQKAIVGRSLVGIEVCMPDDSNGYHWAASVAPTPNSALAKQLQTYAVKTGNRPLVELELLFDADFPFSPPFARVVRPRFAFRTGHITSGGSICIEVLTKDGWTSAYSIEALLVQIQALINDSDPPAKLDMNSLHRPYGMDEARQAFKRVAADHGWRV